MRNQTKGAAPSRPQCNTHAHCELIPSDFNRTLSPEACPKFTSVQCIQSQTQCKPTFDRRRRQIRMILHKVRCRDHDQTERRMFMDARKLDAQLIAEGYPLEYPSEWGSNWPAECKRKGLPDPFLSLETNFIMLGDTQAPTEESNPPTEANNGNPQRPPAGSRNRVTRKFGGRHE